MHYLKLTAVGLVCALSEVIVASKYFCISVQKFPHLITELSRTMHNQLFSSHISAKPLRLLFASPRLSISWLGILIFYLAHVLLLIQRLNSFGQLCPRCQPRHLWRTRSCLGWRRYIYDRCRSSSIFWFTFIQFLTCKIQPFMIPNLSTIRKLLIPANLILVKVWLTPIYG